MAQFKNNFRCVILSPKNLVFESEVNSLFIIGDRSALMGQYYIPFTKSRKKLIWSGWSWPRKELGKVVERDFSRGKRIIIDLGGFQRSYQDEKQDLMKLISSYRTKEAACNFIELYK